MLAIMFIVLFAGCTTTSPRLFSVWKKQRPPTRMLMTVAPSSLQDQDNPLQQGMVCRVYFFAGDDPTPIKVDGEMSFEAYDQRRRRNDGRPDGKYDVAANQLSTHMRKDIVGDSYVFWLPCAPKEKTRVLVKAEFHPKNGPDVVSKSVSVDLAPQMIVTKSTFDPKANQPDRQLAKLSLKTEVFDPKVAPASYQKASAK